MAGVINRNFNSNDRTLEKYKVAAKMAVLKQPSTDVLKSQGGWVQPNKPS